MREVRFYKLDPGECPIEMFLDSLSGKQAQKVAWTLQLIEEMDFVPTKYFKKLVNTNDIWEVIVQAGNNIFRLLGFLDAGSLVILNHAFQKKTQKTPKKKSTSQKQENKITSTGGYHE